MLRENLQDAGEIIQNILTQPLDIEEASKNTSLISAAIDYIETNGESNDLAKILETFKRYPDSTQLLVMELDILSRELSSGHEII